MSPRTSIPTALRGMVWLGLASAILVGSISPGIAADPNPNADLAALLAAGEFAPALRLAERTTDTGQRDALYREIASAQARAGARDAWPATLMRVASDRTRQAALVDLSPQQPAGAPGGGPEPDFESLIELITSTIAPTTWDESGGPGSIKEFESGVRIDAEGVLRRAVRQEDTARLIRLRVAALAPKATAGPQRESGLRKISLPRLEKCVQLRLAQGRLPTAEMSLLAGLRRIQYVFVYPDDIVLAGPAGAWQTGNEGRWVSQADGRPLVQLDDLVVILRHLASAPDATFGCSITPREEALARTKSFLEQSSRTPLKLGRRAAWLEQVRSQLGQQDVQVRGIDPATRAARTLVEADYHMKLIGMGLEPGTLGVKSYLNLVSVKRGEAPPPLEVLRWWFTLDYDAIRTTQERDVFELHGRGVKVMSENELLTKLGKRVHTGASEPLNQQFAESFNADFEKLAARYPIYAELQNLGDLALVAALVQVEGLPERAAWHLTCFGPRGNYVPARSRAPTAVDTVMNHRVIQGKYILAGISGGVRVDPWKFVTGEQVKVDTYGALKAGRSASAPRKLPPDAWWWD